MTRYVPTFYFLALSISFSWGQNVSSADSLKIMNQTDRVFELFTDPKYQEFEKISTAEIYCSMCLSRPDSITASYGIDRKSSFDEYIQDIGESDMFARAKKKMDVMLVADNNRWSDISVFFTVYQRDELAEGHEGGQLGFFFKKENGEFKFSGIDTVP